MDSKEYQKHLYCLREEQQKALHETDSNINQWEKFKSDYVALKDRLKTLPDQLTYDVMVPFSKMGFMPGKLVHTNEILVLLGDNWFVDRSAKQAAQIVTRRLASVDKQLEELYKQRKLLEPRRDFTEDLQNIAQGGGDVFDINEEYDEEKEKQWKDKHKKNVAEHHRKLKKEQTERQKKKSESKTMTDEELWQRLDELERKELEEKEMDMSDSEANIEAPNFHQSVPTDQTETHNTQVTEELPPKLESSENESDTSTSESLDSDDFYVEKEIENSSQESEEKEIRSAVIHFSHTKQKSPDGTWAASNTSAEPGTILNPADIYTKFKSQDGPTSILKKTKPGGQREVRERRERQRVVEFETATDEEEESRLNPIQEAKLRQRQQKAFTGTVKENASSQSTAKTFIPPEIPKHVSKFKTRSSQSAAPATQGPSTVASVNTDSSETIKPVSRFKAQRQKLNET